MYLFPWYFRKWHSLCWFCQYYSSFHLKPDQLCIFYLCPMLKKSHCYSFPINDFKLIESQMSVCAINSAEGASSYTNAPLVCSGHCTRHVFLQHHFLWLWHLPCIQKQHKKVLLVRFYAFPFAVGKVAEKPSGYKNTLLQWKLITFIVILPHAAVWSLKQWLVDYGILQHKDFISAKAFGKFFFKSHFIETYLFL